MLMSVEITEQDIRLGTKGKYTQNNCAVGRAIKRTLGLRGRRAEGLIVSDETLDYDNTSSHYGSWVTLAILSERVRAVIERIDNGETIEPFTFNLNINKKAMKKAGLLA